MGVYCPICKTHQPIVRNITSDGAPVSKASDILARVLGCGHTLSGGKHKEFIAECNKVDQKAFEEIQKIQEAAQSKKSALWETMNAPEEGN
ncbi:MAG: hypothetical protein WC749_07725 [Dehalococcoidia bacterium]